MSIDYGDRSDESIPKGDEKLLTVTEAKKALGVSRATLYRMMDAGKIFPVPVPDVLQRPFRHYFTQAEIDRVLAEAKRKHQQA